MKICIYFGFIIRFKFGNGKLRTFIRTNDDGIKEVFYIKLYAKDSLVCKLYFVCGPVHIYFIVSIQQAII